MDRTIIGPCPDWYEARQRELALAMGRVSALCAWAEPRPTRKQELARQEWARLLGEAHRLQQQAGF